MFTLFEKFLITTIIIRVPIIKPIQPISLHALVDLIGRFPNQVIGFVYQKGKPVFYFAIFGDRQSKEKNASHPFKKLRWFAYLQLSTLPSTQHKLFF